MYKKILFGLILVCLIFSSCEQEVHVHEYDNGVIVEKPTCESIGVKVYTCSCGAEKSEVLDKLGHDPNELQSTNPTCTKEGHDVVTCIRCGKVLTDKTKEKLAHSWDTGVVVDEATCSSIGSKKFTCTSCGAEKLETIPKLEHIPSEKKTREATCTQKGGTYTECIVCGEILTSGDIPALGHDWGTGTVINEPTCISIGSKKFTCSRCHEEKIEILEKVDHKKSSQKSKTATCSEKGMVYTECEVCKEILDVISETNALGHDWGEGVVIKASTCASIGSKKFTCERCKAEKLETTDKLDHVPGKEETTLASCTEDGKAVIKCVLCQEVLNSQILKAQGHKWKFKERTLEPTCETTGSDVYECETCHETEERSVDALGHSFTGKVETIPATCTKAGSKYGHCSRCDRAVYEEIPMIAHTDNGGLVTTAPSCTAKGEMTYSCSVCKTVLRKEEIAALGHSEGTAITTKKASCTETGISVVKCTRCSEVLKTNVLEKLDHDMEKTATKQTATCFQTGVDSYKCKNCDYTEDRTIAKDMTNHSGASFTYKVDSGNEATYFTEGMQTEYCNYCGGKTGNTKKYFKDLTGFWEGSTEENSMTVIYTASFADGKMTFGTGMDGAMYGLTGTVYIEGEPLSYTVSTSGITATSEDSSTFFEKVKENGDKITMKFEGMSGEVTVEFERKTTIAHTHTFEGDWEPAEIKEGENIVATIHKKNLSCTEHSAFVFFEGRHTYSGTTGEDSNVCTKCGAKEYFKINMLSNDVYFVECGGSVTLPALPAGYDVWSSICGEQVAGEVFNPTAAQNALAGFNNAEGVRRDITFTTSSFTSDGYVITAGHKCATHGSLYFDGGKCIDCEKEKYAVGNTVSLGGINWKVLSFDDTEGRALLISKDAVSSRIFSSYSPLLYRDSDVFTYLNNEFYLSSGLRSVTNLVTVRANAENIDFTGSDCLFLLSETEVNTYFADDNARKDFSADWWLRTTSETEVKYVSRSDGKIYSASPIETKSVRPACWVSIY